VRCAAFSADGKLLLTGCWPSDEDEDRKTHINIWDVSVIVREAGLEDLLSHNDDTAKKPLLDVCCVSFRMVLLLVILHPRLMLPDDETHQLKMLIDYPEDSLTMLESSTHYAGMHPTRNAIVLSYQYLVA
jgi:hypothetical protein